MFEESLSFIWVALNIWCICLDWFSFCCVWHQRIFTSLYPFNSGALWWPHYPNPLHGDVFCLPPQQDRGKKCKTHTLGCHSFGKAPWRGSSSKECISKLAQMYSQELNGSDVLSLKQNLELHPSIVFYTVLPSLCQCNSQYALKWESNFLVIPLNIFPNLSW